MLSLEISRCGRVYLAQSENAVKYVNRIYARARLWNESAELIDDSLDIQARWPMINTEDVKVDFDFDDFF